jgi:D-glycerate 3-kinase
VLPDSSLDAVDIVYDAISNALAEKASRPLIVGVCGSQGSGKSTLCETLATRFGQAGMTVANLSLDDLYLPLATRARLSQEVHPLLRTRGVPGTHDVALGMETLDALASSQQVRLPRFDKAIDDRRSPEQWDSLVGPAQLVLFEGWCVGARPQTEADLAQPINELEATEDALGTWRKYVNDRLASDYQSLYGRIGLLVLLAAPSFDVVLEWRIQQEHALREKTKLSGSSGAGVMSDASVARFIQHYERLTRHTLAEMPGRADLVIRLGKDRSVVA